MLNVAAVPWKHDAPKPSLMGTGFEGRAGKQGSAGEADTGSGGGELERMWGALRPGVGAPALRLGWTERNQSTDTLAPTHGWGWRRKLTHS